MTLVLKISEEEIREWIRAKAREALGVEIKDEQMQMMIKTYHRSQEFVDATQFHVQCVVNQCVVKR